MKMLIAEDDLTSRTILAAVVRKWGYDPVAVEDGEAAWQVLQEDDAPRLLLLDWEMPLLNGLDLCKRIREQKSSDPPYLILLTARSHTDDIVAGLDGGANDYILKPFDNAELQARLQVGQRMLYLQQELNNAKQAMAFQASHDPLTELLNRRAIMEAMEQGMTQTVAGAQPYYVCMCDIDHFKAINDDYGHLAGDAILREVADRLKAIIGSTGQVGRYGGEEFLVLLNSDENQVQGLFENLCREIGDKPYIYEEKKLQVTMSCGVARFSPSDDHPDESTLLAAADESLYEAKSTGRNRVVFAPRDLTGA